MNYWLIICRSLPFSYLTFGASHISGFGILFFHIYNKLYFMNNTYLVATNKEGIIIGGIGGYLIGKFFFGDINLTALTETQGIIDPFISVGKSTIELAKTKVVIMTTLIGATLGAFIDNELKEGFLRRFR